MKSRLEFALGIARRAGAVFMGTEIIRDAVRRNKAKLVILAADASENTKKRLKNSCDFYGVRLFETQLTMDRLSSGVGIGRLTSAVAVTGHSVIRLVNDAIKAEAAENA